MLCINLYYLLFPVTCKCLCFGKILQYFIEFWSQKMYILFAGKRVDLLLSVWRCFPIVLGWCLYDKCNQFFWLHADDVLSFVYVVFHKEQ